MVRGTLHWNTNLSLPSSTTHPFLLLTDASSRFKPEVNNEASKRSISKTSTPVIPNVICTALTCAAGAHNKPW